MVKSHADNPSVLLRTRVNRSNLARYYAYKEIKMTIENKSTDGQNKQQVNTSVLRTIDKSDKKIH